MRKKPQSKYSGEIIPMYKRFCTLCRTYQWFVYEGVCDRCAVLENRGPLRSSPEVFPAQRKEEANAMHEDAVQD